MRLEDLQPTIAVRGILPEALVTIVSVQWYGDNALELTYKDPAGRVSNEVLYRSDEGRLQVTEKGKPWSFDGDGKLFRLVAEAHRIRFGGEHGGVMRQAIQQRGRQLLVAGEDGDPFGEGEIGRDDGGTALVAVGEQIEEELAAGAVVPVASAGTTTAAPWVSSWPRTLAKSRAASRGPCAPWS